MKFSPCLALLTVFGCTQFENRNADTAYSLIRSSTTDIPRIHVATFDTKDGEKYNRENCQIAADLFQGQPGVSVKYWCEKGFFRK